jgi:hypothetical protein
VYINATSMSGHGLVSVEGGAATNGGGGSGGRLAIKVMWQIIVTSKRFL